MVSACISHVKQRGVAHVGVVGPPPADLHYPAPERRTAPPCVRLQTWGEQNTEAEAHWQLSYAAECGVNLVVRPRGGGRGGGVAAVRA